MRLLGHRADLLRFARTGSEGLDLVLTDPAPARLVRRTATRKLRHAMVRQVGSPRVPGNMIHACFNSATVVFPSLVTASASAIDAVLAP
jgi:hypothetical protein